MFMFFDWKVTSEYKTIASPQELHEAILLRLADSKLEVRSTDFTEDSFKIVAALKSKQAYIMSYEGKYSNFGSPFSEIWYNDRKIIVSAQEPAVVSILLLLETLMILLFTYEVIAHGALIMVLFPVLFITVHCWFMRHLVQKCYKEAIRCATQCIPQMVKK